MAFHVYPDPQTNPLNLDAGAINDPPVSIEELISTGTPRTMFIRVVMLGSGCAPPPAGALDPTFRLGAGGAPVDLPIGPVRSIFNAGGQEVGNARVTKDPNTAYLYLVTVFVLVTGSSWQLAIRNNDTAAHGFTWVAASSDAEARQPWIHLQASSDYNVLPNQTVPKTLEVANKGTGPLTVTDAEGTSLGSGFTLSAVPAAINPNACGNLEISFAGAANPGSATTTYTATSNDTTAQAGGLHNRRVTLSAVTGRLEVMLMLDASGSMAYTPAGTVPVAATDTRWNHLKVAAKQFLDLLANFGGGQGRFAVGIFPDITGATAPYPPAPAPSAATLQAPADITTAAIAAAKNALDAHTPVRGGGATPMGRGIGTAIGTTLGSFGYFDGTADARTFNRRWLVLMSDGAHNSDPPHPRDFFEGSGGLPSFTDKGVRVLTVAYGDIGQTPFHVDPILLKDIAADSGGQPLDAGLDDDGSQLPQSFRKAITAGLSLGAVVDPGGVLSRGAPEARHRVGIGPWDNKVAFVVTWRTFDTERVSVELLTPTCELIGEDAEDPHVIVNRHPRYRIFTFDRDFLRNAADPASPRYGTWTLIVRAHGLDFEGPMSIEPYDYEVIVDSRLRLDVAFDAPRHAAGDAIGLAASVTLDGAPVRGAAVTARADTPGGSGANFLALAEASAGELEAARADLGDESDVIAIGIKAHALARKGVFFRPLRRPGTIPMPDPADQGVHRATVAAAATTVPGSYGYHVVATGQTADGTAFRREQRLHTRVDVRPRAEFTLVDIVYRNVIVDGRPVVAADVRVWPRDRFGNAVLVDPEVDPTVVITAEGASFTGPLVGNLDGSYSRPLRYPPDARPAIGVQVAGEEIVGRVDATPLEDLRYVDEVVQFTLGGEAEDGANEHRDPQAALGDVTAKEEFVSLGAFGALTVRVRGEVVVAHGDDDVTVFVRRDTELRPYLVEARRAGGRHEWVTLGESPGVTQAFSLRAAHLRAATAVRVSDRSGQVRDDDLNPVATPGVSLLGVGIRKAALVPGDRRGCLEWILRWLPWLRRRRPLG
jgi:hypothetical protein